MDTIHDDYLVVFRNFHQSRTNHQNKDSEDARESNSNYTLATTLYVFNANFTPTYISSFPESNRTTSYHLVLSTY